MPSIESTWSRYVQGLGINLLVATVNKLMKIKKQKGNGGQMGNKCVVWLLPCVMHLVLQPRGALVVQTEDHDHHLSA